MDINCGEFLPDPVPDHPLLNGRKEIGRGENTIVLDGEVVDGQARVLKVISSPTDYDFLTAPNRPTGLHFPVVHADHGEVGLSSRGYPFHIVEVEKLYPLPDDGITSEVGAASDLASQISTLYCEACLEWRHMSQKMGRMALHQLVVAPMDWPDSVLQSLRALEVFADVYEALPDLIKPDNLMLRKDGTLVFSDPFFMG